jgi:hypothetical protein
VNNAGFSGLLIGISKSKDENIMTRQFEIALIDLDIIRDAADIRFVAVNHHPYSHISMLRHARMNVKWGIERHGRMKKS